MKPNIVCDYCCYDIYMNGQLQEYTTRDSLREEKEKWKNQ